MLNLAESFYGLISGQQLPVFTETQLPGFPGWPETVRTFQVILSLFCVNVPA